MAEANATATSSGATSSQAQNSTQSANQSASSSQASTENPSGTVQTQSQSLKAPLIADPKEFLERARQRRGIVKPAEVAKPAENDNGKAPLQASPANDNAAKPAVAAEVTKPAEAVKPPEAPADDMAARVAKLSRERREFDQQRKAFADEQARAKAEREKTEKENAAKIAQAATVEKAAAALKSGDIAGMLKLLDAGANESAVALQLLEQLQKQDERPMSPAEVERMISDRMKSEQAARDKAAEEKRQADEEKAIADAKATLETARENYMAACLGLFSKEKYPFIASHGLTREAVVAYAESQREGGRISAPDPESLLQHFEDKYRKQAEAAGWGPKTAEAPKPAPSPSLSPSSLVQDQGSRLVSGGPVKTLEQKRAEIRTRLRIAGRQT